MSDAPEERFVTRTEFIEMKTDLIYAQTAIAYLYTGIQKLGTLAFELSRSTSLAAKSGTGISESDAEKMREMAKELEEIMGAAHGCIWNDDGTLR